jgi:hypothetical protein
MVVEVVVLSLGRFVAVVAIVLSAGCGGAREAGQTATSTSTTGSPTTGLETTTLPATTSPTVTAIAPTTSAIQSTGADLRSILEGYEQAAVAESDGYWQAFEFDRCWRVSLPGRDAADPPVDQDDVVARGDVFDCYLRTDPPADVLNDFYVIVVNDSGTAWANGAGTDGSFFFPAMTSGLLCREYLAHPDFTLSMGGHGPEDPSQDSWWMDNDWAYASVLAYWFMDGQRANMDVDRDGVPCELLFDPATVARVWAGNQP